MKHDMSKQLFERAAGLFPGGAVPPLAMMARATLDGTIRMIRSGILSTDDEARQLEAVTRFIMAGLAAGPHAGGGAAPAGG